MQQLYTAIVPLVKIHFPNLNLKPIIELDNENHFTNQRFCINEPSNNLYQHMYLKAMLGCSNLRYYEQFKVLWPIEEEHYFDNFCLILHFEFYCHNNWKRFSIFPTSFSFCCNSSRVTMEENRIILHYLKFSPRIDQNSKHVEKINSFCFFVSKYSPEFFTIDKLILKSLLI